jgi:hypothetical protein
MQKKDRRHAFVFILFICLLAASHNSSSVLLSVFLLVIFLLTKWLSQKISLFRIKSYLNAATLLTALSISAAWLMFPASFTFERIVEMAFAGLSGGGTPSAEQVPVRFFDLARIDLFGAIRLVLVYYGADILLLLTTFAGLVILLKMRKQLNDTSKFLVVLNGIMFLSIPAGILIRIGGFRILYITRLLFPIFSGISILYLSKKKTWIRPIILLSIILFATLQFYRCQPLIPSANVLSGDLPVNEPIVYVNLVNSVYQRQMIDFAKNHVTGRILSDAVTGNQILGLAGFDFVSKHLFWDHGYPLDKNKLGREYDCFLIHLPGISGGFEEKAEIRTRHIILESIYNSTIAYTNGESYILVHNLTKQQN